MGVAVGSVLFLRWLNYHGLTGAAVPPYTEWASSAGNFHQIFSELMAGGGRLVVGRDPNFGDAWRGCAEKNGVME